jgi:hypothetical protein
MRRLCALAAGAFAWSEVLTLTIYNARATG